MKRFYIPTKILSGVDTADALEEMHIGRLLVVSDPFFAENGTARRISRAQAVEVFAEVSPDPSVELAARGAALVQSFRPDVILALGGGSAMDCAKAMACLSGHRPRFIAVPTTSGSGSEVTDFAILTHQGVKHPLVEEGLRPDVAILDPALLENLPPTLVADGGMDLISHALEAIAATGSSALTDALAEKAFLRALEKLPKSFLGDVAARLPVHEAATMAGMAFSAAGLGLCHAAAHALGGTFHVPHGRLNAILLPAVVEYNAPGAGAKYARLARTAGLSAGTDTVAVRSLRNALTRLRRQLKMPDTLAQAGIPRKQLEAQLETIAAAALADPCCGTNPVPVTREGVRWLLHQVAGHE